MKIKTENWTNSKRGREERGDEIKTRTDIVSDKSKKEQTVNKTWQKLKIRQGK